MTAPPPPVAYIDEGKIHPDPENRPDRSGDEGLRGMAETIRHLGILVPLWVAKHPSRPGHFLIKDGHRRYRAGQLAGVAQYPCTLRRPTQAEAKAGTVLAEIVLNTHRNPWGPVEFALKLGKLRDGGLSQADIARYTGLTESGISYHLELLEADEETLNRARRGELPIGAIHDAVKAARAAGPQPGGTEIKRRPDAGRPHQYRKAPPHFDATHPLAAAAHGLCVQRGHPAYERLNKTACGKCWETAIRTDQDHQGSRPLTSVAPVTFQPAAEAS